MVDDRKDSKHLIEQTEVDFSTPRFDEMEAANDQPVQPIPVNRPSAFNTIAATVRRGVASRLKC